MTLTTITITTRDVFHRSPRHGDRVIFRAPRVRPGIGDEVIVPRPVVVSLESGQGSAELEPGPCQVSFRAGTSVDTRPFEVIVPDKGPVTLRDLLEKNYEWSPQILSEAQKAVGKAEKAATSAQVSQQGAKKAAQDARSASDGITALRDQAAQAATRAEGAADQAAGSATAADTSAKASQRSASTARSAETRTTTAANRATEEANRSEQAAVHAATAGARATGEADRAKQEADRSKAEADRAATAADRIGTADAVTAARRAAEAAATRSGAQADRSKAEADRAEAAASTATSGISPQVRADIDAKATKAELTTALVGKADKTHKHPSADISGTYSVDKNSKNMVIKTDGAGDLNVRGRIYVYPQGNVTLSGTTFESKHAVNKAYVDAADEALGQRIDAKADTAALEQKADKAQVDQLATALEGKAAQAAMDTALAGKANTAHTHLSADVTDAVDAGAQSQSATYAKRLVRLDSSGHLRAKAPVTPTSVATKKYVDDEIATAAQAGVAASKMAQASAGWARFYRVGNLVTIQVANGGAATTADIPTGFRPAVRPCYVPVTWLSDPASVVLLNLDRNSGKAQIERAPGTSNAVHGTAVYMTTDAWPGT
ncbi:hypothetical protein MHT86_08015 [Corynebacterium mastitidis]|uniref:Uncharacterized protein n=1 Tax=Corynebacterium mastitidis TaxID=161890 RepID=A0A2N0X8X1_9CORY|nr:hypothetical protein [Corynebacterium mastitidis]MCH6197438.1 hypothetical protein [Corynebacterium mastitidis]PKF69158.1 hypothetical protein CXB45_03160 [Corynebacterium mastitidis]